MTEELRFGEVVPAASVVPAFDVADLAEQLVASANGQGIQLTGDGGLLTALTKRVLQNALEAEMDAHLGYAKHDRAGADQHGPADGNVRNGSSPKTLRTEVGEVTIQVPRDRSGTFEPKIVPKHSRRLSGFDEAVISSMPRA